MQTVGIIPSPGIAHQHAKNIIPNVKQLLSKRTKHNRWNFEIKVDLMIGSAEDVHESVEKAAQIKEAHQWDYVVCLTDLPSISDNKVVVSDFNSDKHVAMLSLPSLGFIDLKRKLVKTMTSLIEQLYYNQPKNKNAPHPFVRVKAVEPDEDATSKQRYINILFIISWIQLIGGLTRANQPWKNIF
ncbi:MAG: 5,10-methylene-tetrahydrofolate dehydrogenase, partial [Staphylococcus epidermidis]|nr:5,10-methylene-tetrahydrofolate dehydrogenase [Staphylococcus epidermidis]MDU1641637.1 5,10-methylene-tetrahydrofolate dehydrogenase [Staphylococcus epidermidis]